MKIKVMMAVGILLLSATNSSSQKTGIFTCHTDVGKILHSGVNIWFTL